MKDQSPGLSDDHRSNNFDFLRLVGAFLVLFSHCFPIAQIPGVRDPLARVTINDEMSFGKLGVIIFFLISGYLITQSFQNSTSLFSYCKARVLRIFPGLLVVLLLCAYVMGPLMTNLSLSDYFSHPDVHKYVRTVFLFPTYYELPGVFLDNRYRSVVNGSLWSIPYEFLCYILVACLGLLRLNGSRFIAVVLVVFGLLIDSKFMDVFGPTMPTFGQLSGYNILHTCYPFLCGILFYSFREDILYKPVYASVCVFVLCFASFYGGMYAATCLCGGYLLFYYAFHGPKLTHGVAKYGDFSYGGYLYSFPIQQVVVSLHGGTMGPYVQLLICLPLTFIFAWMSWHLIEKRALSLKKVLVLPDLRLARVINQVAAKIGSWIDRLYRGIAQQALLLAILFGGAVSILYAQYTFPPTFIQFPYSGSSKTLSGGWQPQDLHEKYRWINVKADVQLYTEKRHFILGVTGYVPEAFTEVTEMRILVNGNELACYNVRGKPGLDISLPVDMGVPDQKFSVSIVFNDYHHFAPEAPDKRMLSALISTISVK